MPLNRFSKLFFQPATSFSYANIIVYKTHAETAWLGYIEG